MSLALRLEQALTAVAEALESGDALAAAAAQVHGLRMVRCDELTVGMQLDAVGARVVELWQ